MDCDDKDIKLLTDAPIPRLLLHFSLPAILGIISIAMYETIDRIFIGQFASDEGLAIIAVGVPFVAFINACCLMLRIGSSSVFSRALGSGNIAGTERVLANAFLLQLFCGVTIAAVGYFFSELIARVCGANDDLLAASATYIRIIAVGATFLFIGNCANSLMRATGEPRKGLLLISGSCGLNIILDAIFVGFYGWGVPGAAWATVISQGVGAVYGLWHFLAKDKVARLSLTNLSADFTYLQSIISIGFAYAMFEINFVVESAISNHMLEAYGGAVALAGVAVVGNCVSFLYTPMTGLDEGVQPMIGYNFSAGYKERVRKIAYYALAIGLAFFIISFIAIQIGAETIVAMFVDDDAEFQAVTARALRITFSVAPLMTSMIIIPGILSALGEAKYNFILNVIIQLVVQIPALLILPRFLGADGVWLSFPLVDIVATVLGIYFLLKSFRRHGLMAAKTSETMAD